MSHHAEPRLYPADSPEVLAAFAARTGIDVGSLPHRDAVILASTYFLAVREANATRRLFEEEPPEQPAQPALPYWSPWAFGALSALIVAAVFVFARASS